MQYAIVISAGHKALANKTHNSQRLEKNMGFLSDILWAIHDFLSMFSPIVGGVA